MRLFFIRHGQSEHNRRARLNETNQYVSNLTDQGRKETQKAAKKLAKLQFDIIYVSPLERCRQTADIINSLQAKPRKVVVDDRLSEFKTGFNNRSAITWSIKIMFSRNRLHKKFKDGQSLMESATIIKGFWDEILTKHPQQNVLIVAHLFTFQIFYHYAYNRNLTIPWFWRQRIYIAPSEIHEFKSQRYK